MEVYLIKHGIYWEGEVVVKVFITKEKAEKELQQLEKNNPDSDYHYYNLEVWNAE